VSLRVDYDERAISQATAFLDDPPGIRAVLDAIDQLADDPRPDGSFPYGSPDLRRLRIGRYRVRYEISEDAIPPLDPVSAIPNRSARMPDSDDPTQRDQCWMASCALGTVGRPARGCMVSTARLVRGGADGSHDRSGSGGHRPAPPMVGLARTSGGPAFFVVKMIRRAGGHHGLPQPHDDRVAARGDGGEPVGLAICDT
jgi:mRNA interferase RelE/StbE